MLRGYEAHNLEHYRLQPYSLKSYCGRGLVRSTGQGDIDRNNYGRHVRPRRSFSNAHGADRRRVHPCLRRRPRCLVCPLRREGCLHAERSADAGKVRGAESKSRRYARGQNQDDPSGLNQRGKISGYLVGVARHLIEETEAGRIGFVLPPHGLSVLNDQEQQFFPRV
jgi:hypothetical protein